jgi:glycosyltransferase involved in cell wall biosynthesis
VVADNASTDGSRAIIERYAADPRVRPIFNERNIGRNANHNVGWRESRGTYVVFLSADDFLLPGHLDTLEGLLHRHPDADLTYARAVDVDANGRPIRLNQLGGVVDVESYGPGRNELAELLVYSSFMWLPTMLFPRRLLEESGGFDETINVAADFDLQLRLLAGGSRVAFVNRALVCVRFHGANASGEGFMRSGDLVRDYAGIYERALCPTPPAAMRERQQGVVAILRQYIRNVAPEHREAVMRDCGPAIERIAKALQASGDQPWDAEPLVSVIIPTSGRLADLFAALDSLLAQTYRHWEAIVVNDGPADLAPLFARFERDARLRFVRMGRPSGPAAARNAALRLGCGTIVAYLDDDDRFAPGHLASLVAAIVAGADVAVAEAELVVDAPENWFGTRRIEYARGPLSYPDRAWGAALLVAPCIPLTAIGHRRNVIDRFGSFILGLPVCEAWEFLARVAPQTRATFTQQRTAEIHWRPGLVEQELAGGVDQLAALAQFVYQRLPSDSPEILAARARYPAALAGRGPALRSGATAVDAERQLAQLFTTPWQLQRIEERT